jgi:hypothetical protein
VRLSHQSQALFPDGRHLFSNLYGIAQRTAVTGAFASDAYLPHICSALSLLFMQRALAKPRVGHSKRVLCHCRGLTGVSVAWSRPAPARPRSRVDSCRRPAGMAAPPTTGDATATSLVAENGVAAACGFGGKEAGPANVPASSPAPPAFPAQGTGVSPSGAFGPVVSTGSLTAHECGAPGREGVGGNIAQPASLPCAMQHGSRNCTAASSVPAASTIALPQTSTVTSAAFGHRNPASGHASLAAVPPGCAPGSALALPEHQTMVNNWAIPSLPRGGLRPTPLIPSCMAPPSTMPQAMPYQGASGPLPPPHARPGHGHAQPGNGHRIALGLFGGSGGGHAPLFTSTTCAPPIGNAFAGITSGPTLRAGAPTWSAARTGAVPVTSGPPAACTGGGGTHGSLPARGASQPHKRARLSTPANAGNGNGTSNGHNGGTGGGATAHGNGGGAAASNAGSKPASAASVAGVLAPAPCPRALVPGVASADGLEHWPVLPYMERVEAALAKGNDQPLTFHRQVTRPLSAVILAVMHNLGMQVRCCRSGWPSSRRLWLQLCC